VPVTTTAVAGDSGYAGIIVGVLLALIGIVVLIILARYLYRRHLVSKDIGEFEPEMQEDFYAIARAALRDNAGASDNYQSYNDFN
jgi:hypothetical protein